MVLSSSWPIQWYWSHSLMTPIDSQFSIPKFTQPPNRLRSPNPRSKTTAEMANKKSEGEDISSAQAVFLGALAPGVNGPTWTTLRLAFVMLGVSLAVMLALAFSSSDSWLVLHVVFLVLITITLFLLLSWFLSQTGLVSVEHQIREMGLVPNDQDTSRTTTIKFEEKTL